MISTAIIVIPNMLAIFDPRIFPIAKLVCIFTIDKNVAINNVKYQKAKSECVWIGYYKMDDQFNKCIKEKMSKENEYEC